MICFADIDSLMAREDEPIVHTVLALLRSVKMGDAAAGYELHRYTVAFAMVATAHPLLHVLSWRDLVATPADVLSVDKLLDLGPHIRQLFTRNFCDAPSTLHEPQFLKTKASQYKQLDTISFVLFCSLPRIKHNRLQFPSDASTDEMIHVVQVAIAMLFGIIPGATMQPTWRMLVMLTVNMLSVLTMQHDELLRWCKRNFMVIRLAMLEYYIYFSRSFMPAEDELSDYILHEKTPSHDVLSDEKTARPHGKSKHTHVIHEDTAMQRNICMAIDHMRQLTLQQDKLEWRNICDRCVQAIEKCNRITRNKRVKTPHGCMDTGTTIQSKTDTPSISAADITSARARPVALCAAYNYLTLGLSMRETLLIQHIHSFVRIYNLPRNLAAIQQSVARHRVQTLGDLEDVRYRYYMCLQCVVARRKSEHRIKINCDNANNIETYCMTCDSSTHILFVNLIGRILLHENSWLYFCIHCQTVHWYSAYGAEFQGNVHCQAQGNCCYHLQIDCIGNTHTRKTHHSRKVKTNSSDNTEINSTSHKIRSDLHAFMEFDDATSRVYSVVELNSSKLNVTNKLKRCLFCSKILQLNVFFVLDDVLGVMQCVYLCGSHSPNPHYMKLVYNLQTFMSMITQKRERRHLIKTSM